jgi:PKD repeat protein
MMYMGDAGSITEQVGYAEADSILGPYNKFDGNPAIPFGPSGSIDAGTVADPWVVEFYGTYYIGYTVSSSKSSPWRTSYVTTTDWETFVKSNEIILDLGPPGTWDDSNAFRGAVTRFGDTYYFPYTGAPSAGAYVMGIATQPAFMREQELNRCEDVFEFCDTFDDDSFDSGKWIVEQYGSGQELRESGGVLSMVALSGSRYGYVQMRGDQAVGTSTLLETRARHANAGLQCDSDADTDAAGELGFKPADMGFGQDLIRIMDYPFAEFYTIHSAAGGAMPDPRPGYTETDLPLAADWQDYAVHRTDDGYVDFWVDGTMSSVSLQPPYVPTTSLYPWLMSYAEPCAGSTTFEVDWIRVRNWCGADAAAVVGAEEALNSPPTAEAGGPYQTDEGIPVMLDASGSSDPDDNIVSHKWDLDNDGHYDDATGLTTQHTFGDDGIYTVGLQVTDDGGLVDTDEVTVEVLNIAPEVSVDILEQTVQYSDGIAVVTVTATDVAADPMTAAAVGLPDDVTLADNGCSVADGSRTCTWTLSGNTDEAEGQYPVTVTVSDGDSGQTETATTINVEPEDARIRFDEGNPVSVQVTEDGGHSGPFALTIYVREAYDGMWEPNGEPEAFPGDVGLADVSMTLMPVGPGGSVPGTCTPTGVDGSGYNAWLTVVCELDGVPVNTYVAKVTVAGGYYVGYTEDALTVYDPSLGFTTGGGWFYWPGTTDRTNFGFTMKYNRKATKVKGSLLLIRHADDDEIYRVKSNALDGLAVGVGEGLGWASFSGKATYLEPGWTEPEGNHDFIVYVEDRNEPGRGTDRFWIEVHDKNDEVIGVLSMERYALEHAAEIEGGNIAVPH